MKNVQMLTLSLAVIGIAVLGGAAAASADSIVPAAPVVTGGPIFHWSYGLSIDSLEFIPPNTGAQPCTTTGSVGTGTQCAFFTLFDVRGLVGGTPTFNSVVPGLAGIVTTPATGPTGFGTGLPDNPGIPNVGVAFVDTGNQNITGGGVALPLGTLEFDSTLGGGTPGVFSAQSDLVFTRFAGGNQGAVMVPAPEPTSLALLGPGVLGLVGWAVRRRRVIHA